MSSSHKYEPGSLRVSKKDFVQGGLAAHVIVRCTNFNRCHHTLSWSSSDDKAVEGGLETISKRAICAALCSGMGYTQFFEFTDALGLPKIAERDWMVMSQIMIACTPHFNCYVLMIESNCCCQVK